ncbi:hypothetical protein GQ55_3G444100 [Panicum hallii var. hallii]|uniref:NAC domain-containing protein n=1 Tax=Panicum hallii var. hallii TaxID=1504633 RepID=A0A2T7EI91_9POAL|nr:hypothetical protein GQ55_3G444100 [Panicum hallii var. hallii]
MENEPAYSAGGPGHFTTGYQDFPMCFQESPYGPCNVQDLLLEFNAGLTHLPDPYPAAAGDIAGPYPYMAAADVFGGMDSAPPELIQPLQVNAAGPGPYPAGDTTGPYRATAGMGVLHMAMESASGEAIAGAGLAQPDPYSAVDIDLSAATDKEMVRLLCERYEHHKREAKEESQSLSPLEASAAAGLVQPDPWDLPRRCYAARKKFGSDEKTRRGCWKERDSEFTAIRGDPWLPRALRYVGFRRTLEFHTDDGTKTDWLMHEYAMLHHSDGHLFLKEEIVLCNVFNNGKDGVPYPSTNTANDGEPEGELDGNNLPHNDHCLHLHHDAVVQSDQAPSSGTKRPRADGPKTRTTGESGVWQHFTKIYIEAPKEAGSKKKDCYSLVYAVCHGCDKVFRASPKNGTSSLRRHAATCQCKHMHATSS